MEVRTLNAHCIQKHTLNSVQKEEKEKKEQGSFELAHSLRPTILDQVNECLDNRGTSLGHQSPHNTCHTMAQANPNTGGLQPANYPELYSLMPDVLDGVYTTYLAPFGPESGEQPATSFWPQMMSQKCSSCFCLIPCPGLCLRSSLFVGLSLAHLLFQMTVLCPFTISQHTPVVPLFL
jgi:hypothetical protein